MGTFVKYSGTNDVIMCLYILLPFVSNMFLVYDFENFCKM